MQSLDKRLMALEAEMCKARPYEHLTDAELDQRIAALRAELGETESTTDEGKNHVEQ